jgi:hypothetical protein
MFLCGSKPSVFILCFPERLYYFNFKGAISPQRAAEEERNAEVFSVAL